MLIATQIPYRGRFAPSPSGPLHFGSLVAALGSYLDARAHNGSWLVRIEDVDLPRCQPGADSLILETLERFGLHWDEAVIWQSQRFALYREKLALLDEKGKIYPCYCTRKQIKAQGGHNRTQCQANQPGKEQLAATRFLNQIPVKQFHDRLLGKVSIPETEARQDFILHRRDQLPAYQLAVVVDDIEQNINQVVRGADLLHTTGWQQQLYTAFSRQLPGYLHLPLVLDKNGNKLSKQNHAEPLISEDVVKQLIAALQFLGMDPGQDYQNASRDELLSWAINHWKQQLR